LPYFGLGAGAHGYVAGLRTANILSPGAYIQRLSPGWERVEDIQLAFPLTPATAHAGPVDRQAEIAETMMMGLRLVREGVSRNGFQERFGEGLDGVFGDQIEQTIALGLLEWAGPDGDRLRLTPRGRLLGNQVFVRFI
jgi:oxygen-independent coproporphyrinogen-3 oxidase